MDENHTETSKNLQSEEPGKDQKKEKLSLEESFARLDEVIRKLEDGSLPLEESFRLYKEGMDLLKSGREQIDTIEKKVQQINDDGEISDF